MTFKVLGRRTGPNDESRDWQSLDVIATDTTYVRFRCNEVTAICPETKQRDFYRLDIKVHVAGITIESKSLKMFLAAFANTGLFAEGLAECVAHAIACAIAKTGKAHNDDGEFDGQLVVVYAKQRSRGGIAIEAEASCTIYDAHAEIAHLPEARS